MINDHERHRALIKTRISAVERESRPDLGGLAALLDDLAALQVYADKSDTDAERLRAMMARCAHGHDHCANPFCDGVRRDDGEYCAECAPFTLGKGCAGLASVLEERPKRPNLVADADSARAQIRLKRRAFVRKLQG
jgi:hypothetical protein